MERTPAVYILASKRNGTLYIGVTSNLPKRVWEHKNGVTGGFTSEHSVQRLVWYECHEVMESAIAREKRLKRFKRAEKIALIEHMNPNWNELFASIL